jgi:PAT family beta-lactamase induction signal transducer AmpG
MNHSTSAKLALLGSLYFSQGLPFGFFTQALPVLLRKQGHSLENVGLASLLALPWALKFLWAPVVDRYGSERFGRRKSWIVPLQLVAIGVLAALASATELPSLHVLFGVVFLLNLVAATQDIATDGLAVSMLSSSERGLANGVQVAGYRVGMVAGGGALLILYDDLGQAGIFLSMAALTALATLPIAITREPRTVVSKDEPANVVHFVRRQGAPRILGLLVAYKAGDAFATGMLRPFLADAGYTLSDIGWLLGTVGFVAGLLGALAGGALVNRLGRKRALLVFGAAQAMTVLGYAYLAAGQLSRGPLYAVCAAEHFAGGMATAALFTCMMDWCSREAAATDYTVQASAVVIATGAAGALSGFSAQHLGFAGHFALAAALCLGSLVVVQRWFPAVDAAERLRRGTKELLSCV